MLSFAGNELLARLPIELDDVLELFDDLGHSWPVVGILRPHELDQLDDLRAPLFAKTSHRRSEKEFQSGTSRRRDRNLPLTLSTYCLIDGVLVHTLPRKFLVRDVPL